MARYRIYPTAARDAGLPEHCAHARYVWNLAWNLHQFGQELETYGKASRRVGRDGREYIHQKRRAGPPTAGVRGAGSDAHRGPRRVRMAGGGTRRRDAVECL